MASSPFLLPLALPLTLPLTLHLTFRLCPLSLRHHRSLRLRPLFTLH